ncbi:hypothetical protein LAZ67_16001365 [Cordylochernes scorpioides]|uniref:ATP-dependent DNA helicase n=1 Tax=Cordylochernes scorpioides TaxID=51811 RepID=A0ABY6LCI2_9ARAC|nr:hypothetical protein LAZ67_16001365 [Cordylochernes scorpioides]
MVGRDPYRSQGFMVWAGIFLGGRTALHIFRQGTLTGQRYRDEILAAYVMPQALEMAATRQYGQGHGLDTAGMEVNTILELETNGPEDYLFATNGLRYMEPNVNTRIRQRSRPSSSLSPVTFQPQQFTQNFSQYMETKHWIEALNRDGFSASRKVVLIFMTERGQETRETGKYLAECGTCLLIGRDVTVAIASSGIAATLLDGGRTAHSALKLPLNMQVIETPTSEENSWNNILFSPTIMPPKRNAIGRSTHQAKRRREYRASETSEQRQARQERNRVHTAHARSLETSGESQARQGINRVHTAHARSLETSGESQARQERNRVHTVHARSLETSGESQARQ